MSLDLANGTATAAPRVTPEQALDVLAQLHAQLGDVASETRAIVGLRATSEHAVELVDVDLAPNGVLTVRDDVTGLVVVTAEELAADDEVVTVQQLLCVLRDGTEIGTTRAADLADPGAVPVWRTDRTPEDAAESLRPRDLASNTARRAFGLPSVVDELPSVSDVLARGWLLMVASEALQRFDGPDGPRDVEVEELADVAARPLPGGVTRDQEVPTWAALHHAAVDGHLEVGPFSVDRTHAQWLDATGLAQLLDRTLPAIEELLGSLQVLGSDDLLAWAIGWLSACDWYEGN